ncbi:DNA polymerase III subunit alpha [Spiractinospora alimapuensis]|uniref:DNA polymerase III subunit alpha n=1 Tax=Spiractinospora alimapuensis TaxID=2820884 RepID=UPI001F1BFFCD|nr:DNA polymerase III subunit alpha [Spiractinospora alimapuensis]QVQ52601.1 DNA polymerase III subunit alpha [Spiractinospora alimapuensis]
MGEAGTPAFPHLRTVSSGSMRYGTVHPPTLVARAVELGMDILALTDRDGVYGAVKHVRACQAAGIRPVLGASLALTGGGRVTLLARGQTGWASLCRLITTAHTNLGKPHLSPADIAERAAGVVVLLGPDSDVGHALADQHPETARRLLSRWRMHCETVLEIVDHLGPGQRRHARAALDLAADTRTLAVLTNAVRYPTPDGAEVARVLDEAQRLLPGGAPPETDSGEAYLKDTPTMREVAERVCAGDATAARRLLAHTRALAESLALDPDTDLGMAQAHLPATPDAVTALWRDCQRGMERRGLHTDPQARARLARELAIIEAKGFSGYFRTVADITQRIRERGIRVSIRGSGAGSLVNHLIGISTINPLDHGLLMERFLTPSRTGLPDIDLDVESARRLEAYDTIFEAYPHSACVSMMETYRARSAIRDTGAALGIPPVEIDTLAKAFPHISARRIRSAADDLPELRSLGLDRPPVRALLRLAERLDGLPRHIAMHPCGIVVSNAGLPDRAPTEPSQLGYSMVQYDKDDVEEMGLIKLDVIGVRMQSAMAHALDEVERVSGERIDIDAVPDGDPATYAMIGSSRTMGCFQIESPGQRELVSRLRPHNLEDLIADISLFRPGPVNSDMISPFLATRDGREEPRYPAAALRDVLAPTGGVVIFHEQVLGVLHAMTGCGLDAAEAMRRRLGDEEGARQVRERFTAMALECGHDPTVVEHVWEILASFGAFGFCKAHGAAFALPTYQSAWLKRHHPAAFYAGVLTHDPGMYPRRVILADARHFDVPILPVDVNASLGQWRVEWAGQRWGIRASLADVKGISGAEVTRITDGQPYTSLPDFVDRAAVSHDVTDRLVRVGAFDALYAVGEGPQAPHRRDLLLRADAVDRVHRRRGVASGQLPLAVQDRETAARLPEMTTAEEIQTELEVLGYEVGHHLLDSYAEVTAALRRLGAVSARDLHRTRHGQEVVVFGVKVATQTPAVPSGQRIIFTTLDDGTGLSDLTFFESVQDHCAATVFGSWLLVARGRVRRQTHGLPTINATDAYDLDDLARAWYDGGLRGMWEELARRGGSSRGGVGGARVRHSTGYTVSAYADLPTTQQAPRKLWHSSPGSAGQ